MADPLNRPTAVMRRLSECLLVLSVAATVVWYGQTKSPKFSEEELRKGKLSMAGLTLSSPASPPLGNRDRFYRVEEVSVEYDENGNIIKLFGGHISLNGKVIIPKTADLDLCRELLGDPLVDASTYARWAGGERTYVVLWKGPPNRQRVGLTTIPDYHKNSKISE